MVFLASSTIFSGSYLFHLILSERAFRGTSQHLRSSAGHNGGSSGSVGQMGQMGRRGGEGPCPVRARKQRRAEPRAGQRKWTGFAGLCQEGLHCYVLVF